MDNSSRSGLLFLKRVFSLAATKGVVFVAGFVSSIISARVLGVEGRGIYGAALAIGGIGAQFMNLGMHSASVYMLSKNPEKKNQAWGNVAVLTAVSGVVAVLAYLVLNRFPLENISGPILMLACFSIPVLLYVYLQQNILIGLRQVMHYNILETFGGIAFPALLALSILFGRVTPALAFLLYIFGQTATGLAGAYVLRRKARALPRPSKSVFLETLPFGIKAYVASLFSFLVIRANILMVNEMLGTVSTGLYTLAVSLSDVVMMLPQVLGLLLFPEMASMGSDVDRHRFMKKTLLFFGALMIGVTIAAAFMCKLLIRPLYGADFVPSGDIFVILMPGVFFMSLQSILSNFFAAKNMWMGNILTPIAGFAVNVILNVLLISRYEMRGAAIASGVAYFIMFSFMLFRFVLDGRKLFRAKGVV